MITTPSGSAHILSSLNPIHILRSLYRNRELIWNLTKRDLKSTYQSSFLGALWPVIVPLLMLLIYTFVFSVVFQVRWSTGTSQETPRGEFALILFAGLTPFNFFSMVINRSPGLVLTVPNYVKKVVFPLEILPLVVVGSAFITSLINIVLLLIGHMLVFRSFPMAVLLLPFAYIPLILLTLGLAWFLSSLGVFVRDIGQAIPVIVQILFFMTPIFYSVDRVPEGLRALLLLNPLAPIVDAFRRTLIWNQSLDWRVWGAATLVSILVAVLGFAWFSATKRAFSDVM